MEIRGMNLTQGKQINASNHKDRQPLHFSALCSHNLPLCSTFLLCHRIKRATLPAISPSFSLFRINQHSQSSENTMLVRMAQFYRALALAQNGWLVDAQAQIDYFESFCDRAFVSIEHSLYQLLKGIVAAHQQKLQEARKLLRDFLSDVRDSTFEFYFQMELRLVAGWLRRIEGSDPTQESSSTSPEAIRELDAMVGVDSVKGAFHKVVEKVRRNKIREEQGQCCLPISLHQIFLGNAGSGKTTVAKD